MLSGLAAVVTALAPIPSAYATGGHGASRADGPAVGGWLPYWNTAAALRSVEDAHGLVTEASPFWYSVGDDGQVTARPGGYSAEAVRRLRAAHAAVIPTVTEALNATLAAAFFADPVRSRALVAALVRLAAVNGYDGLDLDFEDLLYGGSADDRAAAAAGYTAFAGNLAASLHARHRRLVVTVGARTSAGGAGIGGDLATFGRVADRVRVMAYDDHVPGHDAGPVGPLPWTGRVLAYTTSVVPAAKVELGVAAYGYEWPVPVSGTCPTDAHRPRGATYSARQAPRVAAAHHVPVVWDGAADEESFVYPDPVTYSGHDADGQEVACQVNRVVWYSDARAVAARYALARAYGVAAIAVWALGGEDVSLWPVLSAA